MGKRPGGTPRKRPPAPSVRKRPAGDLQAQIAREAGLEPLLEVKDAQLATTITTEFADLQKLLDRYRTGKDGFVSYDTVTAAQRKQLSDAVNALAEPLSKMTGAITL